MGWFGKSDHQLTIEAELKRIRIACEANYFVLKDCRKHLFKLATKPKFTYYLKDELMPDTLIYEVVLNPVSSDVVAQTLEVVVGEVTDVYELDTAAASVQFTAPQDSDVTLRLQYTDDAGNKSDWAESFFVAVDTLPPATPVGVGQVTLVAEQEEVVEEPEEPADPPVEDPVDPEVPTDPPEDPPVEEPTDPPVEDPEVPEEPVDPPAEDPEDPPVEEEPPAA